MAFRYRTGVLTGVGLSLVAAFVLPRWGRPAAKATIKGGIFAYETAHETLARLRETLADITAEAVYERTAEHDSVSEVARATAAAKTAENSVSQPAAQNLYAK